jgi:hypothetical protein
VQPSNRIQSKDRASIAAPLSVTDKFVFLMVLLPICFDFKPPQNTFTTVTIQLGMFSVSTLGVLILLMRYRFDFVIKLSTFAKLLIATFVLHTFTVGLLKDQSFYRLFANSLPFFLFCYSLFIWSYAQSRRLDLEETARFLVVIGCATLIAKPFLALLAIDLTWETVRYQILPDCMPLFLALTVVAMVYRLPKWTWVVVPWTFALCFVSVTRTNLFVLALCFLLVGLTRFRDVFTTRVFMRGAVVTTGVTVMVVAGAVFLPGSFTERWSDRLFSANNEVAGDVTGLLRIAEIHYQLTNLIETPQNFIAGSGLAAESGISGPAAERAAITQGPRIYQYEVSQIGHNAYTSLIYFGGAIVGVSVVLLLFFLAFMALRIAPRITSPFLLALCIGYVAFIAQGFLGGVLGSRQGAMFCGVCCGAVLVALRQRFPRHIALAGTGLGRVSLVPRSASNYSVRT